MYLSLFLGIYDYCSRPNNNELFMAFSAGTVWNDAPVFWK